MCLYCGCLETTWKPRSWTMMVFVTDYVILCIVLRSHLSQRETELPFLTFVRRGIFFFYIASLTPFRRYLNQYLGDI